MEKKKKERGAGNGENAKQGKPSIVAYLNFTDRNTSKGILSSQLTSSETVSSEMVEEVQK